MTNLPPDDEPAALDWAPMKPREAAVDELARLSVVPALQQMRDDAQREARSG